ncbi:MAG: hypothetical protein ABI639_10010 [Thermoanaerobaculia bacterium]
MKVLAAALTSFVLGLVSYSSPSFASGDREEQIALQLDQRTDEAIGVFESDELESSRNETARSLVRFRRLVQSEEVSSGEPAIALCRPTVVSLCLLGRFVVTGFFENPYSAPGFLVPAGAQQLTSASGYLWWFSPIVMEIPIKMVDFCGSGQGFKVFAAGLTDFGVDFAVTDMLTGIRRHYINSPRQVFDTIIDGNTPWPCF